MSIETLQKLKAATRAFYDSLSDLDDLPQAWLDGFSNVILLGETNHPDDNPHEPIFEKIHHSDYKRGATAAMHLLTVRQSM
jgi:hypothetical protein